MGEKIRIGRAPDFVVRGQTQADRDAAAATDRLPASALRYLRSKKEEAGFEARRGEAWKKRTRGNALGSAAAHAEMARLDRVIDWLRNESVAAEIAGDRGFAAVLDGFRRETIRFRDRSR